MNNREIKFRAWDKSAKEMYHPVESLRNDWNKIDGCLLVQAIKTEDGRCSMDFGDEILMQFTGILDKNRKEIFQGDVLKDLLSGVIWEVCFGLCVKHAYTGWYVKGLNIDGRQSTLNPDDSDTDMNTQVEIIGNIYQQPELIS